MSKGEDSILPANWTRQKLAALRLELEQFGKRPAVDRLLEDLTWISQASLEERDDEMFSIVVNDALEGVDITQRYPAFYRKLLANPPLLEAFLDILEVLESDREGTLESPPVMTKRDLAFLQTVDAPPVVEEREPGRWSVSWRQTAERLQALFANFGLSPVAAYRDASGLIEEVYATLIRSEAEVGVRRLEVLLEVTWASDPEMLNLLLTVAIFAQGVAEQPQPSLQAIIQWGSYSETAVVDENGQASFPPLPFQAIVDETGTVIDAGLQFSLTPIA
ncbi:MAG: hypothetical protein L0332_11875 [Chloroflexi bacterium]|nr:hypothetical protein [Chloroflexota bacterium]MCI0727406.1 hypothetical protein [Chloroflexota bacterium]